MIDGPDPSELVSLPIDEAGRLYQKDKADHLEFPKHKKRIDRLINELGFDRNHKEGRFANVGKQKDSAVYILEKYLNGMGIDIRDFYKLNSYGFRSDEFTDKHNGLHILFAGCSITFGDSIPLEYTWAHKLYSKISSSQKTSGYFNLGTPGVGMSEILSNILVYLYYYGVPDLIFINFPDAERESSSIDNLDQREIFKNKLLISNLMLIKFLRRILPSKIYAFTWDKTFNAKPNRDIRSAMGLLPFRIKDAERHIFNFTQENSEHKYSDFFIKAMDDAHPGIAVHDFYYNFIYNEYIKSLEV
jgi:hypothetical protein